MVGEKSVEELATEILAYNVERTGSHVGAIYLLENKDLVLTAGYALQKKEMKEVLQVGEGIVGQAALSGKQILLNDIPDTEFTISFASGNTKPKNIVAVPIIRENVLVGVMEFGTLNIYTPLQLDYLNSIAHNIGIAIHVSQNRKRLQDFLEETQAQTEELAGAAK